MAQFWLKIAHLSFSIATTPLLKMIPSHGLRPRLWLLANGDVPLDGSHFHDWIDYNGVAFSIELLEWGRDFGVRIFWQVGSLGIKKI